MQELHIVNSLSVDLNYPQHFSELSNLTILHLNDCNLTSLSGIQSLKNLAFLQAHHNQLVDIRVVGYLHNLRALDLHNNKICSLKHISNLIRLRTVYIMSNKVTNCEELFHIARMQYLVSFDVSDNPFISSQGNYQNLINYVRNKSQSPGSNNDLTNEQRLKIQNAFRRFEMREHYSLAREKRSLMRLEVKKLMDVENYSKQNVELIRSKKLKLYELLQEI